ncbi:MULTISPECIES: methyltransferase [unclassified Roseateles]|uniref:methyltransferase n=1 Tax=unclassified Roseateles TaxID=2626991 RepID=UPI0006F4C2C9|nr:MULTISPECIES: methyltransferase [unclassified Roseateles]KQW42009.1 methyltransferase [Pelomonas sp. Root405]KRA67612.1 methyltransferase [Pelomonas sp. Root662]
MGARLMPAAHWSDAALAWRDRLLGSARFRRWAEAFAPTRWIARRRAAQVFDLVAGFVYSQVLLACVQLRLFDLLLVRGPQTLESLAGQLSLAPAATERLVLAAVSLRLLEVRPHGRFGLGPLGAPLAGNAGLMAMIEHHGALYRDLADPLALLRGEPGAGRLAGFWPYAGTESPDALGTDEVAAYSALMAASQPLVAEQVLQAYPVQRHRRLLDVGGGDGAFACAAARHAPQLQVQVFDLPGVTARAQSRFEQAGLAHRCSAQGGDFFRDTLPAGADLITLLRIVHDHDDARVLHLLRAVRRSLADGGCVLLAEPLADTAGAEAMGHGYFGFYLLAMGRGEPRTEARLRELLAEAGFTRVRRLATRVPLQASVLVAEADRRSSVNLS